MYKLLNTPLLIACAAFAFFPACQKTDMEAQRPSLDTVTDFRQVSVGSRQVTLEWNSTTPQEGATLNVERREGPDGDYKVIGSAEMTANRFADDTAQAGRLYDYRLCSAQACTSNIHTDVPYGQVAVSSEANDQVYLLKLTKSDQAAAAPKSIETAYGDVVTDLGHVNSPSGIAAMPARTELVVANTNRASLIVYPYPPSETLEPRRVIKGERTNLIHPLAVAYLPKTDEIAVLQDKAPHILVYSGTAEGDVAPIRQATFSGDDAEPLSLTADTSTGALYAGFFGKVVKLSSDLSKQTEVDIDDDALAMGLHYAAGTSTLWVSDFMDNSVQGYGVSPDGSCEQTHRLSDAAMDWPSGLVVCGNTLAVTNFGKRSILLYNLADKAAAPRVIQGDQTRLVYPRSVACSPTNDTLIVADYGADALATWPVDSTGNVAPTSWAAHTYEGLSRPRGLYVDASKQELYVASYGSDGIFVYDTKTGTAGKAKRILRGPATKLAGPEGVVVHPQTKEIFVANIIDNSVTVYAAGAEGNSAPIRRVAGEKTGLNWPYGIALNVDTNDFYVSNLKGDTVASWSLDANGDEKPQWVLQGEKAQLQGPEFLYYDEAVHELYVTNAMSGSVGVYSVKYGAPSSPRRMIAGDKTGLNSPEGIWVDHHSDRIYVADFRANTVLVFDRLADGNAEPVALSLSGVSVASATGVAYIP